MVVYDVQVHLQGMGEVCSNETYMGHAGMVIEGKQMQQVERRRTESAKSNNRSRHRGWDPQKS